MRAPASNVADSPSWMRAVSAAVKSRLPSGVSVRLSKPALPRAPRVACPVGSGTNFSGIAQPANEIAVAAVDVDRRRLARHARRAFCRHRERAVGQQARCLRGPGIVIARRHRQREHADRIARAWNRVAAGQRERRSRRRCPPICASEIRRARAPRCGSSGPRCRRKAVRGPVDSGCSRGKLNWPTSVRLVTSCATSGCLTFARGSETGTSARQASKQTRRGAARPTILPSCASKGVCTKVFVAQLDSRSRSWSR